MIRDLNKFLDSDVPFLLSTLQEFEMFTEMNVTLKGGFYSHNSCLFFETRKWLLFQTPRTFIKI